MIAGILDAIRCKDMRWSTRVVWACLENHANGHRFWPMTMEAIVKEIGGTLDTVVSGVKELEQRGIIRRVMRKRRPTVYYMLREYNRDGQNAATEPESEPAETFADPETVSGLTPEEPEPDTEHSPQDFPTTTGQLTPEIPNQTVELRPEKVEYPVPTREESTSKEDPPGRARGRATRSSPRSTIPEGWAPDAKGIAYAHNRGMSDEDIPRESSKFRNYHEARGSLMASWQAAWRTWCDNFRTYRASGGRSAAPSAGGNSSSTGARSSYWAQRVAERERQRNGAMIDGELVA